MKQTDWLHLYIPAGNEHISVPFRIFSESFEWQDPFVALGLRPGEELRIKFTRRLKKGLGEVTVKIRTPEKRGSA